MQKDSSTSSGKRDSNRCLIPAILHKERSHHLQLNCGHPKFSTACAMIQPLVTSYFSTTLHLVRQYEVTKWSWKKVVQIVQTSIRFFRSAFVNNAVATSLLRSKDDGGYPHHTITFSLAQPVVALYVSSSCSAQPPLEPPFVALTILFLLCTVKKEPLLPQRNYAMILILWYNPCKFSTNLIQ